MAFTVLGPKESEEYGDDAHYRFNDHGLLVIEPGDGSRVTMSPGAWMAVVDPSPGEIMHVLSGDQTS